jgi:hypothetical protein
MSPSSFPRFEPQFIDFLENGMISNKRPRIERPTSTGVRFASFDDLEHIRWTISRSDMTQEEIGSCWWTTQEQLHSRREARIVMKRIIGDAARKATMAATIDEAYREACSAVHKADGKRYQQPKDAEVAKLCEDCDVVTSDALRSWALKFSNVQRGLERRLMTKERSEHAMNHRRKVLQAANLAKFVPMPSEGDDSSTCSNDSTVTARDDGMIAAVSVHYSAVARVYARMVGDADTFIVRSENFIFERNVGESYWTGTSCGDVLPMDVQYQQ